MTSTAREQDHAMGEVKNIVSISGGKDSTALLLYALEMGVPVEAVFADTGHEHKQTYEYIDYLERKIGVSIRRVRGDFSEDIRRKRKRVVKEWEVALVKGKPGGWKPKGKAYKKDANGNKVLAVSEPNHEPEDIYTRAETEFFVWKPAIAPVPSWVARERILNALRVLKPTGIPFLDLCLFKGFFPSTRSRFCSDYLKQQTIWQQVMDPALCEGYEVVSWQGIRRDESRQRANATPIEDVGGGLWNYRPLLDWSYEDVFAIHRKHGVEPNPLYKQGMGRVGCMPCIHAGKQEIREIGTRFPEEIERVREWERLVSMANPYGISTFFSTNKTPDEEDGSHSRYGIWEVVEWSKTTRGGKQYDLEAMSMFEGEAPTCSSVYGLCE